MCACVCVSHCLCLNLKIVAVLEKKFLIYVSLSCSNRVLVLMAKILLPQWEKYYWNKIKNSEHIDPCFAMWSAL